MERNYVDWNFFKRCIRIFLTIVPLIVCGYSIYYIIRAATPLFVTVIGASSAVIAGLLTFSSLCSGAMAIFALKDYRPNATTTKYQIYLFSTFLSFILCIAVLIYTSMSSQSYIENSMSEFISLNPSHADVVEFNKEYLNAFEKLKFYFSVGENTNEVYIIITTVWVVCFAAFYIIVEFFEEPNEEYYQ